ncbi:MAG TPA: DUF4111 domain-containing protein, partial [Candidatus Limnocylindria bacterium]|nr:DUF4111 domain-containing protein [Candidatus Limnocylindria bacterium]
DLQRAMVEELDGLLADLVPDTRNVLLTLARMWCTLDTGQMRSKDAAAEWAMERLPAGHRAVLERARHGYQAGGDEAWTEWQERAEACAAEMTAHIRHLATRL